MLELGRKQHQQFQWRVAKALAGALEAEIHANSAALMLRMEFLERLMENPEVDHLRCA